MYKVIKCFTDLRDEGHVYNAGDVFPREGMVVDQARLDALSSEANRQGTPLIAKIHDTKESLSSAAPTPVAKAVGEEAPAPAPAKAKSAPKARSRKAKED